MASFLVTGWVTGLMLFLAVCSLIIALVSFLKEDKWLVAGAVSVLTTILFGFAWYFGVTHIVVQPNTRMVVIDKISGAPVGGIRTPGITTRPVFQYAILQYPGVVDKSFCYDTKPALKEGYELVFTICGVYDARSLDWVRMYEQYDFRGESDMVGYWAVQTKELISGSLKEVDYTKIVQDREGVAAGTKAAIQPWFDDFGVKVSRLTLANWDATSEKVKSLMDDASSASLKKTVEQQLKIAAEAARDRQLYEVETANLINEERGKGLSTLFNSLGLTDDSAKAYLASQTIWNQFAQNPPAGTQLYFGVPIAVQQNQVPSVPAQAPNP